MVETKCQIKPEEVMATIRDETLRHGAGKLCNRSQTDINANYI